MTKLSKDAMAWITTKTSGALYQSVRDVACAKEILTVLQEQEAEMQNVLQMCRMLQDGHDAKDAEIERLNKLVTTYEDNRELAMEEIDALTAENARMREGLESIGGSTLEDAELGRAVRWYFADGDHEAKYDPLTVLRAYRARHSAFANTERAAQENSE